MRRSSGIGHKSRRGWRASWLAVGLALSSCSEDTEPQAGADADVLAWADSGGELNSDGSSDAGAKTAPDYAAVFATDKVHELAIELTAAAAAAQEADAVALLGAFGTGTAAGGGTGGPPSGGQIPPEVVAACAGKATGEACTVSLGGSVTAGKCTVAPNGSGACLPDGMGGGPGGGPAGGGAGGGLSLTARDPGYVGCTVRQGTAVWQHVGIRYKGNSSLTASWQQGIRKLPFRLDFNKYQSEFPATKGQRFHGFAEMTFASNWGDASYLREILAGEVFRDRGIPAARAAFYRVTLDKGDGKGPVYMGLYTSVEDPSDAMMAEVYGDDSGNLYKPDGAAAAWTKFEAASFEKKNNSKAADFTDVQSAIAALHADRSNAAAWRQGLEVWFNVDNYLQMLAINTAIVNWDSYGQMAHNYYLYAVPSDGKRLHWIPWDFNLSMQTGGGGGKGAGQGSGLSLSLAEVTASWPLIRFVLDDPIYRAAYRKHLATAVQGSFEPAAFAKRVQQLHDLIAPHVVGAKGEQAPYSTLSATAAFDASVQELAEHAKTRATAVAAELAKP